jgi:hypothetical protein
MSDKSITGAIPIPEEASDQEINDVAEWLQSLSFEELQVLKNSYLMAKAELFAMQTGKAQHVH